MEPIKVARFTWDMVSPTEVFERRRVYVLRGATVFVAIAELFVDSAELFNADGLLFYLAEVAGRVSKVFFEAITEG